MRFLVDECLSPDLVAIARDRGFSLSTHVTWLGLSGAMADEQAVARLTRKFARLCEAWDRARGE